MLCFPEYQFETNPFRTLLKRISVYIVSVYIVSVSEKKGIFPLKFFPLRHSPETKRSSLPTWNLLILFAVFKTTSTQRLDNRPENLFSSSEFYVTVSPIWCFSSFRALGLIFISTNSSPIPESTSPFANLTWCSVLLQSSVFSSGFADTCKLSTNCLFPHHKILQVCSSIIR